MTAPRRVVAVVLAAGRSERFGGDKLMHLLNGRPLGEHIARTLADIRLAARIAICPAGSPRQSLFGDFEIIENPPPEQGMGTSLALGARRAIALDADAMLVCLADMPYVTAQHLRRSTNAGWRSTAKVITTPCGRRTSRRSHKRKLGPSAKRERAATDYGRRPFGTDRVNSALTSGCRA